MSKFTNGPWEAVKCPKSAAETDDRDWPWLIKYTDGDEKFDLAIVQTDYAEANARLIAAAPAFAEATAKWLQFYDSCVRDKAIGDEPGIAELRAALASIDAP